MAYDLASTQLRQSILNSRSMTIEIKCFKAASDIKFKNFPWILSRFRYWIVGDKNEEILAPPNFGGNGPGLIPALI